MINTKLLIVLGLQTEKGEDEKKNPVFLHYLFSLVDESDDDDDGDGDDKMVFSVPKHHH